MGGYAWITLATNDPYCLGALVLAQSLKRVGTKHDLAVLITPGVTCAMREKLNAVFTVVKEVNVLDSKDETNLALLARPELGVTFTKLHCWTLTQYEKCIFVDADALVIRNCDELFEREELSAAPDVGWPDCFNSGVFVFRPSQKTFASLTAFAASKGSFDGGDQGLLNQYFSDWAHKDIAKHLPFIYNMCSTATYSYLPAYKQFGSDVRIIHFIGNSKPWLQYFDTQTGQVHPSSDSIHLQSLLQHWWNIFCENVHPQLSPVMAWSTLAPIWHDSYPRVSTTAFTLNNHVSHDPTDFTYDEVDKPPPDFSEFHDPWDNYIDIQNKSNDNNIIDKNTDQTDSINNEEYQFHSNNDTNCPLHITHCIDEKHSDYNFRNKLNDNNDDNKHLENVSTNVAADVGKVTESQDKNSNQQYYSDHNYFSKQFPKNDNHDYTEHQHHQHDNFEHDTHCNRSQSNYQYDANDKNSTMNEDEHYSQHNIIVYTDTTSKIIPQTHSQPCTDSKSISCQSKTNSFTEIERENSGIAGALAKITLGIARSPEQEAFEEHMRKQSWEQGKIDYMGRDRFENIWTKICTTISTVNEYETIPPQEEITLENDKPTVTATPSTKSELTETDGAMPTLLQQHDAMIETQSKELIIEKTIEPNAPLCESQTLTTERSTASLPTITTAHTSPDARPGNSEQILALTCSMPKLCIKESDKTCGEIKTELCTKSHTQEDLSISQPTVIPLSQSSQTIIESSTLDTQMTEIPRESLSEESQTIKNSAVPIQVAESVLEADIKESVSEHIKPVTEEAISSISAPIQESISTVVETPLEPPAPARSHSVEALRPSQPNGTDRMDFDNESNETPGRRVTPVPSTAFAVPEEQLASKEPGVPTPAPVPQAKEPVETQRETRETVAEERRDVGQTDNLQMVEHAIASGNLAGESSAEAIKMSESTPTAAPTSGTIVKDLKLKTNVPEKKSSEVLLEESKKKPEEQHEKPMSTTQLQIPGTPIVTAATPPTSPPLDATRSLEEGIKPTKKVVKKLSKKSSSEEKAEGNETEESKKTKKIVKKGTSSVVKKAKESKEKLEEGGDSSTAEKPKKIVKVKKTTKLSQSLEADTSIPDTPPPATSSETPTPPKRKTKSSTSVKSSTTSTSKSESEP